MKEACDQIAAVDLGSNSFHMVVARADTGRVQLLARIRERVSLAAGLDGDGQLSCQARDRALDCLRRFAERLRGLPPHRYRVVGTNTFRKIDDGGEFLHAAEAAMGHGVEILGGDEEARLVFLGIRYDVGETPLPLLAIDIGGGSTELALGTAHAPDIAESVQIGCVALSSRHFKGGRVTKRRLEEAVMAASLELEPIADRFIGQPVDAIASSGTALAIEQIAEESGWSDGGIDRDALRKLRRIVLDAGHVSEIDVKGLSDGRRPVIAGGLAAMIAVFDSLGLESIRTSRCALREGVLVDMVGRITGRDRREQSVTALMDRAHVDPSQAARVTDTSSHLFHAVAPMWNLDGECQRMLHWSAMLHEVGLSISHTDYHRHGEYLVANTNLPGFSRTTQERLAGIVRLHRKRISQNRLPECAKDEQRTIRDLALLLRVAVHLHRSRTDATITGLTMRGSSEGLELTLPQAEAQAHPLTLADLALEADQWNRMGRELCVNVVD